MEQNRIKNTSSTVREIQVILHIKQAPVEQNRIKNTSSTVRGIQVILHIKQAPVKQNRIKNSSSTVREIQVILHIKQAPVEQNRIKNITEIYWPTTWISNALRLVLGISGRVFLFQSHNSYYGYENHCNNQHF